MPSLRLCTIRCFPGWSLVLITSSTKERNRPPRSRYSIYSGSRISQRTASSNCASITPTRIFSSILTSIYSSWSSKNTPRKKSIGRRLIILWVKVASTCRLIGSIIFRQISWWISIGKNTTLGSFEIDTRQWLITQLFIVFHNQGIFCCIPIQDNLPVIHLIAKKPVGILHLLDDESNFPKATDHSFLEKCHYNHALSELYSRPRMSSAEFAIKHYAGQVWYNVEGFLDKNRDTLRPDVVELLISSKISVSFSPFQGNDCSLWNSLKF